MEQAVFLRLFYSNVSKHEEDCRKVNINDVGLEFFPGNP